MSTNPPSTPPAARSSRRAWIAIAVVAVIVAVAIGLVVAVGSDDSKSGSGSTTSRATQTSASSSTSSSTTTPTPTTAAPSDTSSAVWPVAASATRYSDPVAAARGFAVDFIGYTNPGVGEFRAGDARSGEVEVTGAGGQVTTVLVRKLGSDDSWWVLGAGAEDIVLSQPVGLAAVSSPLRLEGRSSAFEGTVQTEIRQDGDAKPLGSGFVTGGSGSTLEPFEGTLTFSTPTADSGALILSTISMENGEISEVTVVRVHFTPPAG